MGAAKAECYGKLRMPFAILYIQINATDSSTHSGKDPQLVESCFLRDVSQPFHELHRKFYKVF